VTSAESTLRCHDARKLCARLVADGTQVAMSLRASTTSVYQWRRAWHAPRVLRR
jgi:hypothetical protein